MAENELMILDEDDAVIEVNSLIKKMEAQVITNDTEYQIVAEFLVRAQVTKKAVEKVFEKELTEAENAKREAEKTRKAVSVRLNTMIEPLEKAKAAASGIMSRYLNDKRILAEQEQRRIDAEARKRIEDQQAAEAARIAALPKSVTPDPVTRVEEAPVTVPVSAPAALAPSAPKVSGLREVVEWKVTILDRAAVPDDYKTLDMARIQREADTLKELLNIPGVKVEKNVRMIPTGR